ncbi:MAG: hypothetical protein WCF94_01550 [bacterium]
MNAPKQNFCRGELNYKLTHSTTTELIDFANKLNREELEELFHQVIYSASYEPQDSTERGILVEAICLKLGRKLSDEELEDTEHRNEIDRLAKETETITDPWILEGHVHRVENAESLLHSPLVFFKILET